MTTEYRLSHTASEIDRKLSEIDNLGKVKSVNGVEPDANGNVVIEVSGQNVNQTSVEPAEDDIPKVYFTGTLPTSKGEGELQLFMRYISKTAKLEYPVTLKVQGDSSASYAKKNFTLKPYEDSTCESKKKLSFKNWPEMNKFVLKAHWIDHSHVRNVGSAKIWGKIVASRSDYDSLPEELRNAPNNGATDGFTCKVFCNGVYQGLYEWIVPKDKLFGQNSDIATHSILNSEKNNQETCAFSTTSPVMSYWSEELQDKMSSNISTSFANLIKFVAGSTDEEFIANAENYFDVQSVIDFDIFARVLCIVDSLCKNQIFFTYDGVKWYEGAWDMDGVLGLPPTGRNWFSYDTEFQSGYVAHLDWGMTNMLYQRVENLFTERFKARYAELRADVLSVENIIEPYERLTDVIKTYDGLLEEDYAETTGDGAFTGIPYTSENNIQQIRNFVAQRVLYVDEAINNLTGSGDNPGGSGGNEESHTHSYTSSVTTTATCTTNGVRTYTCSCGHSYTETIQATGHNYVDGECTKCGEADLNHVEAGILEGVNWHSGYINGNPANPNYGVIGESTVDVYTDAFDVSTLSHIYVEMLSTGTLYSPRIVFWSDATASSKDTCVGKIEGTVGTIWTITGDIPEGALYARLSINNREYNAGGLTSVTVKETADGDVIGYLAYP